LSLLFKNGRIKSSRKDVTLFISSIKEDERLLKHVIEINEAHTIMLMEQKIIDNKQGIQLISALEKLRKRVKPKIKPWLEDIHVYLEEEVIKIAKGAGENLHIAKSRNDQVATAIRMELREELINLLKVMLKFQKNLIEKAEKHIETIIPGYTHLRPAQPITFAHYLLCQFDTFQRSLERIRECFERINACPMGAAAIATTSFPINREKVAELLGFNHILENSIDAVNSRDFILETLGILSIIAIDISRLAEDLIIWSTPEFGLIELPDEFCSTSSIMPHKKNPDVLEVIRSRTSHIIGNLTTCTLTLKALPSGYNLDFQEITPKLWESLHITNQAITMLFDLIMLCKIKESNAEIQSLKFTTLTELIRVLFQKHKISFRAAHKIVGAFVRWLNDNGIDLKDAKPEMLEKIAKEIGDTKLNISSSDFEAVTDVVSFIKNHNVRGGPSPSEVRRMIALRRDLLTRSETRVAEMEDRIREAHENLRNFISKIVQNHITEKFKSGGVTVC
jgi:argininosuccinate lyase